MSGAPVSPRRDPTPDSSVDNPKQLETRRNARNVSSTERLSEGKKRRSDEKDVQSISRNKRQRGSSKGDREDMDDGVKVGTGDAAKVPKKNSEGCRDDYKERGQDKGTVRERRVRDDKVEEGDNEKRTLDSRTGERNLPILRSLPDANGEKMGNRQVVDKRSPVKGRENSDAITKRSDRREHSMKREEASEKMKKRDVEKRNFDDKKSERKLPMLRSAPDTKGDKRINRKSLDERNPVKGREGSGLMSKQRDQKEPPTKRDAPKLVSKPAPRSRKPEDAPANLRERPEFDSKPPKLQSKPLKPESKLAKRQTDTVKRESKPRKPDLKSGRDRSSPSGLRSSSDDGRPDPNRRKQDQRDRERSRELEGDLERSHGRDRDKDRDRGRPRGSDRDKGKDRDWDKIHDSVRGRDGDRDLERERRRRGESRGGRESSRLRDKPRDDDRDRDRPRDRQRDAGRVYEGERERGRERDGDLEGDRGRWRDRDRRDRDWEQSRNGRDRDRETERDRLRADNDRGRDRERASRQSRSETDVKSGRTTREKDRKREKDTGDSHMEGDGDRVSGKDRDAGKAQGPSSRPSSGQGSMGSRNNPRVDGKQEGSGSKGLGAGNQGRKKMDLTSARALRKDLEKRCREATKRCAQKLENKEYELYEEVVKEAFRLSFEWGLAMESELRLLEHLLPLADRLVKKRKIITHYRDLTRHFAAQHLKELEALKRKNGMSYLMRGRNKAYLRMFGLQRMWERDQRVNDGEARRAAGEVIAARRGAGTEGRSAEEMPTDKLMRLKDMADDYGNLVSLLEGVVVDDGEGVEEAGVECKLQ